MVLVTFLAPLVVLAARAVASPSVSRDSYHPISFPISRRINGNGELDHIQKGGQRRSSSNPNLIVNDTGVVYVIDVGVGESNNIYGLILDTVGANTWLGAEQPYTMTSSSVKIGDTMPVKYTSSAYFNGSEYYDTVTFANGLAIYGQSIGVADQDTSSLEGFDPFDGILGIGPDISSVGTVDPDKSSTVPTVTDNLFSQGQINQNIVALFFQPLNTTSVENGEMTFGGTDPSKYTGDITYFPTTTTEPANKLWGLNASFQYGNGRTVILDSSAGVIDSITNLILVAADAYSNYVSATGAVLDEGTGKLSLPSDQYDNLQSLYFCIGNTPYEITKNAQIYPRAWNEFIGGTNESIYLIVQNISYSRLPAGIGFVLGRPFLERFYIALDSGNSSIGFATTQFTEAEIN